MVHWLALKIIEKSAYVKNVKSIIELVPLKYEPLKIHLFANKILISDFSFVASLC